MKTTFAVGKYIINMHDSFWPYALLAEYIIITNIFTNITNNAAVF